MLDQELLDEISTTFVENEKINQIMEDLNHDVNIVYWADKFCDDAFFNNSDLAEALFEYAASKAQDWRDYKALAFAVGRSSGFDDREWAQEFLNEAVKNVALLRDLRTLADAIATPNLSIYDRAYASELYREAFEKSQTAYDFYCLAESLCSVDMLNDKDWAQEVYQKAIEAAQDSDELTYIADSIADEENLGDEQWAEELYAIAQEFDGEKELE